MAIDMSKVTGASSTEFGKSLLAESQASNQRIRDKNAKDANKDAWKSIGLNIGIGYVNDFQEKKQAEFLATEQNAANILTTKNAYTGATLATEQEEAAQAYEAGYDSYFNSIAEKSVRENLTAKYAGQGVYSKIQLDGLVRAGGSTLGKQLRIDHQERYKYAQDYLQTTGEEGKLAYVNVLKKQKPTNLKGMVNGFIGSVTGLSGKDALNARAGEIFDSAKQFENYQTLYQQTKNSDVALLFAEGLPEKLNPAQMVHGKTVIELGEDEFGQKRLGHTMFNPNTQVTYIAELGNGEVTTATSEQTRNVFSSIVSNLETKNPSFVVRGQNIAMKVPEELAKELSENIGKDATAAGIATYAGDKQRQKFIESRMKLIQNQTGAVALQLQSQFTDMGTDQVDAVARSLLTMHIKDPKANVMKKGGGMANPYFTLLAMSNAVASGHMKENGAATAKLLGAGGLNLYSAYKEASVNERTAISKTMSILHERSIDPTTKESPGFDILQQVIIKAEELQIESSQTGNKEDYLSDREAFKDASRLMGTDLSKEVQETLSKEKKLDMANVFKALSVIAGADKDPSITLHKGAAKYKANVAIVQGMTSEQKEGFLSEKNRRIDYLKKAIPEVDYTRRAGMKEELAKLEDSYEAIVALYYKEV